MASSNFDKEIKSSMSNSAKKGKTKKGGVGVKQKDSPEEVAADTKAGIAQNSPQDAAMDARMAGGVHSGAAQPNALPPGFGQDGGGSTNPAHAAMAASIAHAILQKGG